MLHVRRKRIRLPKWWNGRHARLRGVWRKPCGFKSRLRHQSSAITAPVLAIHSSRLLGVEHGYTKRSLVATTYLKGQYYSRLLVPTDLRPIIGRREILKCLRVSTYRDAKLKAAWWEGRLSGLFQYLKVNPNAMKLAQVKPFVSRYIAERLEEWEEAWYGGENPPCDDPTSVMRDDDGEPTQNQWQESLALFSEEAVKDYAHALKHNTLTVAGQLVEDFVRRYRLPVAKGSPLYRFTCRELLKAESVIATQIMERVQGRFTDAYASGIGSTSTNGDSTATVSRLLSDTLKDYFTHYAHRDTRTNKEKQIVFTRFREIMGGDRLLQDITKPDCVAFRDTYSQFPRRIPNTHRGKPVADILAGCPDAVRVTRGTVNQALTDLRHFFTWALKLDYYIGKNPVEGIEYDGVKKASYEPFSDPDLTAVFGLNSFADQRIRRPERFWLLLVLL